MNITNRLFTYPVLCNEKDDYVASIFDATLSTEGSVVNSLRLNFHFEMDNKEIRQTMLDKKAEYVVHIECPTTSFRKTVSSEICSDVEYFIPYRELNGKLELVAFVLATQNIDNFVSDDWNDDFAGLQFDIPKGSILAFCNLPDLIISKDDQDLMKTSSIFSVVRRNTDANIPIDVEPNSDKIRIGLASKEYQLYNKFANIDEAQPIVNALVILPALVYIFEELRQDGNENKYGEKSWYISLERAYKKRGMNLQQVLFDSEKTSLECAQEAMDFPVASALSCIQDLFTADMEDFDE